jgi:hypothetical protein
MLLSPCGQIAPENASPRVVERIHFASCVAGVRNRKTSVAPPRRPGMAGGAGLRFVETFDQRSSSPRQRFAIQQAST